MIQRESEFTIDHDFIDLEIIGEELFISTPIAGGMFLDEPDNENSLYGYIDHVCNDGTQMEGQLTIRIPFCEILDCTVQMNEGNDGVIDKRVEQQIIMLRSELLKMIEKIDTLKFSDKCFGEE
jgi:hypothetical protein